MKRFAKTKIEVKNEPLGVVLSEAALNALARRDALCFEIEQLCRDLNNFADKPLWTPRMLDDYVNALFSVEYGIDSLDFYALEQLKQDLTGRKKILEAK